MKNVFSDFHHNSLWTSLEFLFEKRLGYKLYRPIGMEWYPDYWKIGEPYGELGILTANQYLGHNTLDEKGMTLEEFKNTPIDIVIASVPQNIKPYKELVAQYHPEAKFVFQMGNMFNEVLNNMHEIPNLLSSTSEIGIPPTCNAVFYHQEFDLDIFKPQGEPINKLASFVNCLPQNGHINEFKELKNLLPEYEVKMYGASCDDGIIGTNQEIADIMNSCKFGIHLKYGADGFGHIIHNWYACGKPVIVNGNDYKNKLAGELLVDGETCIDIDKHSISEVVDIIKNISEEKYKDMCDRSYKIFKYNVDFDKEEIKIRTFIDNLH